MPGSVSERGCPAAICRAKVMPTLPCVPSTLTKRAATATRPARAAVSPSAMVYGEKRLSGTYYGSIRPAIDFAVLADLDMDKRIDLDSLISRTYKFDEINEGFRLLTTGAVARGVIVF